MKDKCGEGYERSLFQVFSIQKITDIPPSKHHLSLYTRLMTVLNNEDWQSMKEKMTQHHFSLYAKLMTVLNK